MPFIDWVNKHQATQSSQQVPYRMLRTASSHGETDGANANNLLIQGHNLMAVKALLPLHRGQVKCILIDPPKTVSRQKVGGGRESKGDFLMTHRENLVGMCIAEQIQRALYK